jgi:hypothetical protein
MYLLSCDGKFGVLYKPLLVLVLTTCRHVVRLIFQRFSSLRLSVVLVLLLQQYDSRVRSGPVLQHDICTGVLPVLIQYWSTGVPVMHSEH